MCVLCADATTGDAVGQTEDAAIANLPELLNSRAAIALLVVSCADCASDRGAYSVESEVAGCLQSGSQTVGY